MILLINLLWVGVKKGGGARVTLCPQQKYFFLFEL